MRTPNAEQRHNKAVPFQKQLQMGPRIAPFISCAVKDRLLHPSQPIVSQDSLCICDGWICFWGTQSKVVARYNFKCKYKVSTRDPNTVKGQGQCYEAKRIALLIIWQIFLLTDLVFELFKVLMERENRDFDTAPELSVEWIPVRSFLFYHDFYHSPSWCSFPLPSVGFFFFFSVSTVIPVVPLLTVDSDRNRHTPLVKIEPGDRPNSKVKGRIIGNKSINGWCNFSTVITLCSGYLLQNDQFQHKTWLWTWMICNQQIHCPHKKLYK